MEFQWLLNVFIAPAIWLARAKPGRGAIAESLVLVRRCDRKVLSGQFPAPIRLSEGVVAYPAEAVERWIEEQSSDAIQALIPKSASNLDGCRGRGRPRK